MLPNGNLVLEAHRTIRNNHEYWLHSLSGICRREDIGPGNIVLSKDIANLQIEKQSSGRSATATNAAGSRGCGMSLLRSRRREPKSEIRNKSQCSNIQVDRAAHA